MDLVNPAPRTRARPQSQRLSHFLTALQACLFGLLLIALAPSSQAQSDTQFRVVVYAQGGPTELSMMEQRAQELMRAFPVQLEWRATKQFRPRDVLSTHDGAALATIWLDLRQPSRAVLYLVDESRERFLVRVVPLDDGYDEVAYESLSTIIETSVEALISGAIVGVDRKAAAQEVSALEEASPSPSDAPPVSKTPAPGAVPPQSTKPISKPSSTTPIAEAPWALDASYRLAALSSAPTLIHGPEVGFRYRGPHRRIAFAGLLSAGYRLPVRWEAAGIGATFTGFGLHVGPGFRFCLGGAACMSAFALAGLEYQVVEPWVGADGAKARDKAILLSPRLGGVWEAECELGHGLALWGLVGAEADLLGHHFDVQQGDRIEAVLVPWRVQPFGQVGLRFVP
jgi:hypothetical protein